MLELPEELGIKANKRDLLFFGVHTSFSFYEFQGVFYYSWTGNIDALVLEKEEVDKVAWFGIGQLKDVILLIKESSWSVMGYEDKLLEQIEVFSRD